MYNPVVSIIGSGNLACHLANAFHKNGSVIREVYSRNFNHATDLAVQVNASPARQLSELKPADLLIVCVTDSAIADVAGALGNFPGLVVHTSGSTDMNILNIQTNFGVFYPFQTFTQNMEVSFESIPILVEANTPENLDLLKQWAGQLSSRVIEVNSLQRLHLHLAAVFASNFTNHMYAISKQLLDDSGLSLSMLYPLIEETTRKAILSENPAMVQTGPAVRQNLEIIEKHKELLLDRPLWQKIYTFVSTSIMEMKK